MRTALSLVLAALLLLAGSAAAYETVVVGPEGSRGVTVERCPLNDSDPEMKALLESLMGRGPCGSPSGCPERRVGYEQGGERLARYIIAQYERCVSEGYYATELLSRIAFTSTDLGFQFLRSQVEAGPESVGMREYRFSLQALARVRDPRAIDVAVSVAQSDEPKRIRSLAVQVAGEVMRASGVAPSYAVEFLRVLEDRTSEPLGIRRGAWLELNALEDAGLIARRSRGPDPVESVRP